MSDFPILTISILVPLVGAVALMLLPEKKAVTGARSSLPQVVALGVSLLTLVLVGALALGYDTGADGYQFSEVHQWIGAFGAHYAVGVDGIGLTLILLTAILTPVVIAASWHDVSTGSTGAAPRGGRRSRSSPGCWPSRALRSARSPRSTSSSSTSSSRRR